MKHPNIFFVFADQMRAQATGYAGDPNISTPCLNGLSAESINFVNATSNCPICTPYRACLLSGQYPLTHGLFMNDLCMPDNSHSLAQELKCGGYDTAWIGKWHLDGHGRSKPIPEERRQGFDYWKAFECSHDYLNSQYYDGNDTAPKFWNGYDAYAQADDAISYIGSRCGNDKPFALFLSLGSPHDPYDTAPEDLKVLYKPERLILRDNVPVHRRAIAQKQLAGYYAHITAIDKCLEKINAALTGFGLSKNTIFVFTSDHGDMIESQWHLNDTRYGARKQLPYDESVMVPFLLRYPEKYGSGGMSFSEPLSTPDIMPTLLSMCGLGIPNTVEGVDMCPFIYGKTVPPRMGVLIASYHPFADWQTARGGRPYRGIRTKRYTFVRDLNGPWLLFDNITDPYQLKNMVNQSIFADIQYNLDRELAIMLKEQKDDFERPEQLRERWNYKINDYEEIPF